MTDKWWTLENNPLVSVIVLNYNGAAVLKDCLDSIFKTTYSPFEVIVVDNDSQDGSDKIAERDYRCIFIKNPVNLGYCGGNNVGIKRAKGHYIVLINNDTTVEPDWLTELVRAALREKADFCQPKILMNDKKTLNSTGLDIHVSGFGLLRGLGEIDRKQYDNKTNVVGCHGACIFASRKAIEMTGGLDEIFVAFNDDTDWSWRALLQNLRIIYVPKAIVYHKWGNAFSLKNCRKFRLVERNRLIMLFTNYSKKTIMALSPFLILTELATMMYCFYDRTLVSAKIGSYAELLLIRNYLKIRRNSIQARRKVADISLIQKFRVDFAHSYLVTAVKPLNALYRLFWKLISKTINS